MQLAMYRTKKELNELFQQFSVEYKSGELADLNTNQIANRYGVHHQTIGRWLVRVESKPSKKQSSRRMIQELPKDWQWIKLSVGDDLKEKFDKLGREQKILLYKIMDTEIKLMSTDTNTTGDFPLIQSEDIVNRTIALKVSPGAIAIWGNTPTIREKNQFSRASWAINKVIVPFLSIVVK